MKKIIILILAVSIFYNCDNTRTDGDEQLIEADHDDRQEYDQLRKEGDYYVLSGTARERKAAFEKAASELEEDINKLKDSTTDEAVIQKLDEVQEKIDQARKKAAETDELIAENKSERANEKIEEAREKLEEARETYDESLDEIGM